jgi:hypothetical protein
VHLAPSGHIAACSFAEEKRWRKLDKHDQDDCEYGNENEYLAHFCIPSSAFGTSSA